MADRHADENRHAPGLVREIPRKRSAPAAATAPPPTSSPWPAAADYKPGDQISYYIKATPKKVAAYEAAKLASDFDPQNRDENIDYYVAKLDELVKKFGERERRQRQPRNRKPGLLRSIMVPQLGDPDSLPETR